MVLCGLSLVRFSGRERERNPCHRQHNEPWEVVTDYGMETLPGGSAARCARHYIGKEKNWQEKFKKDTRTPAGARDVKIGKVLRWLQQDGVGSRKGRNNGGLALFFAVSDR